MGCHASAGDLPDPGSEPASLHWQVGHLTTIATWEAPYFNHIAALSSSVCFSLLIFLHSHELVNYQRKNEYFLKSIQDIFCQNNLAEVIYICSKHILNIIFNWNIESVPLYYKNIYEFLLEFCQPLLMTTCECLRRWMVIWWDRGKEGFFFWERGCFVKDSGRSDHTRLRLRKPSSPCCVDTLNPWRWPKIKRWSWNDQD